MDTVKAEVKRGTVKIKDELHHQAAIRASMRRQKIQDVIDEAVAKYLAEAGLIEIEGGTDERSQSGAPPA